MTSAAHRTFGAVAAVAVTAAVVWGLFVVGSPEARRMEKLDERRLGDLQRIAYEMRELVYDERARVLRRPLFDDLTALAEAARNRAITRLDPETGAPYGYRVIDEYSYELCAGFDRPRDADRDVFWNHPAGRHCFVLDVRDAP